MAIRKGWRFNRDLCVTQRQARIAGVALKELQTLNETEKGLALAIERSSLQRVGPYWTLRTMWRRLLTRARARVSTPELREQIDGVALLSEDEEANATSVTIHDIVDVHTEVCYFINTAYVV